MNDLEYPIVKQSPISMIGTGGLVGSYNFASAVADGEYIDDLFSAFLYDGNGGSQTINNGIDLSGEGGLVWFKNRATNTGVNLGSVLQDTVRGKTKFNRAQSDSVEETSSSMITSFNSNGFTIGSDTNINFSNDTVVSWTFRKEPKFFDVVTYTGNGSSSGQEVSHSLGSVPGCVIIKCLQSNDAHSKANYWIVYHRSLTNQHFLYLNSTEDEDGAGWFQQSDVTDSYVRVPKSGGNTAQTNTMNRDGYAYVMYLFAHDESVFGSEGNNSVINCGSYSGNGSSDGPDINLGWEAQWLLVKRSSGSEDWMLFDHMRTSRRQDMWLDDARPNNSNGDGDGAGSDSQPFLNWTSTGFKLSSNTPHTNNSGDTYIYIAVRRPDGYAGKPVTAGTQVFTPVFGSSGAPLFKTPNHYVDWSLQKNSNFATTTATWNVISRLRSQEIINPDDNEAEGWNTYHSFDFQNGQSNFTGGSGIRFAWNWRRYAGMDVVQYTGNGAGPRNIIHSLNNIPEMIVVKKLNGTGGWQTYHVGTGNTKYLYWNQDYQAQISSAVWADTTPTKSVFTVGGGAEVNENTYLYQAFLFASVSGVSKLGSYTGTSSNPSVTITTGFSPRFLLIKRTDSARDWNVFDTVRGIGSGFNDYRLTLNTTAAQNNGQYVDVTATGFTAQSTLDVGTDGGEYIYYAHA